jgi:aspartyl-tRNA synthetase
MLLAGENSIREVIAFPKTRGGQDPLTGAPTPITVQQRAEAGVDAKPKPVGGTGAGAGTAGVAVPVEPT